MSRYIRTLTIIALLIPITSNGESMIGNFLKKMQTPSRDLSEGRPGIKKVGSNGLYIYKLDNGIPSRPSGAKRDVITNYQQLDKEADEAVRNEKHVLYGSEQSPIRNPSVVAAWDRANEAQKRLEDHREYMERVRKTRKNISDKKSITK